MLANAHAKALVAGLGHSAASLAQLEKTAVMVIQRTNEKDSSIGLAGSPSNTGNASLEHIEEIRR